METCRKVVAVEIFVFEGKMCKRVGPVNDDWNAAFASHLNHTLDRQDLSSQIDDVAHQDDFRLRRDVFFKQADNFIRIF